MTYILTCGCKSQYGGFHCEWDSKTRECEPAVAYGCLCEKHYTEYDARPAQYEPQTKPLSDDEIDNIWAGISTGDDCVDMHEFARRIEERHGIK